MKEIIGSSNRYLDINLNDLSFSVFDLSNEERDLYIGGKGVGLKIFNDRLGDHLTEVDPLGEENILCMMMGLFVGTGAACSARFDAVTKSPLTGIMVSSSCGGPFGMACKTAGWDGVIIQGKSAKPIYLYINGDGVEFRDAAAVWGMGTQVAQKVICPNKREGAVCIGPAGENLVNFANAASGHRFLGRGGIGAVMGSKNLKAVVAFGKTHKIMPALPKMFKKTKAKSIRFMNKDKFTIKYRNFGTNSGVNPGVDAGFVPIRNFKRRTDERFRALSGEAMAEKYNTEPSACMPCTVLCGHKGTYPDGKVRQIPEYETIGMFGGNIENYDPDLIAVWNDLMNELGMDTISAGGTIAWAMEASEKGIRKSDLKFGEFSNIDSILKDIAQRKGEGDELANGSRWLSNKYGGKEYAMHVKGMEMAAYDPRGAWGQGLTYAVTNRGGCHLGSYLVANEIFFGFLNPYTTLSKARWANFFEDLFTALNCCHTCQFAAFSYILMPPIARFTPNFILKPAMQFMPSIAQKLLDWSVLSRYVWAISGRKMTMYQFYNVGRRVHVLERLMNTRMGISHKDDTLPSRFLTEADTAHKVKKVVNLDPMVKQYYKIKGYDKNGIPKPSTLKKLGLK